MDSSSFGEARELGKTDCAERWPLLVALIQMMPERFDAFGDFARIGNVPIHLLAGRQPGDRVDYCRGRKFGTKPGIQNSVSCLPIMSCNHEPATRPATFLFRWRQLKSFLSKMLRQIDSNKERGKLALFSMVSTIFGTFLAHGFRLQKRSVTTSYPPRWSTICTSAWRTDSDPIADGATIRSHIS